MTTTDLQEIHHYHNKNFYTNELILCSICHKRFRMTSLCLSHAVYQIYLFDAYIIVTDQHFAASMTMEHIRHI